MVDFGLDCCRSPSLVSMVIFLDNQVPISAMEESSSRFVSTTSLFLGFFNGITAVVVGDGDKLSSELIWFFLCIWNDGIELSSTSDGGSMYFRVTVGKGI